MTDIQIIQLGLDRIHPGPWQPRERERMSDESVAELAADIKMRGLLNPLIGRAIEGNGGPVEVELIAGERRWRAAQLAGLRHWATGSRGRGWRTSCERRWPGPFNLRS